MTQSLMLDIETLGQSHDAVVLSAGAVSFNRDGITDKKEWFLEVEPQIKLGRKIDYATLQWWNKQSDEARAIFQRQNTVNITYFCHELATFFTTNCGKDGRVWGNGASFDMPIIESLIKDNKMTVPWSYWRHRCFRTIKGMFPLDVPFEGIKHGALPDALHQAKYLVRLFSERPELDK